MIALLVTLLLFCLAIWTARTLLAAFSIPEPIPTVILVVIVIVAVLYLVQMFGGGSYLPRLR